MPLDQQANTVVRQPEEMGGPALPLRHAVEANPSRPELGQAIAVENKHRRFRRDVGVETTQTGSQTEGGKNV